MHQLRALWGRDLRLHRGLYNRGLCFDSTLHGLLRGCLQNWCLDRRWDLSFYLSLGRSWDLGFDLGLSLLLNFRDCFFLGWLHDCSLGS